VRDLELRRIKGKYEWKDGLFCFDRGGVRFIIKLPIKAEGQVRKWLF